MNGILSTPGLLPTLMGAIPFKPYYLMLMDDLLEDVDDDDESSDEEEEREEPQKEDKRTSLTERRTAKIVRSEWRLAQIPSTGGDESVTDKQSIREHLTSATLDVDGVPTPSPLIRVEAAPGPMGRCGCTKNSYDNLGIFII